jgi:hypothetical protein
MKTNKLKNSTNSFSLTPLGACAIFLACSAFPLSALGQAAPAAATKTAQVVYDASGKPIGVEIQEPNGETEFVPTAPSDAAPAPSSPAPQAAPPMPAQPAPQVNVLTVPAAMPPGPPAPAGVAVVATPAQLATGEVNFTYFHDQLAPYGAWIQVPDLGWVWRPDSALAVNPDWRPYYDMGQWVYTDNGWFWASDYTWGDIPFHYGRWVRHPGLGWVWAPDYVWGPSWVLWRQADAEGSIGWAPLPPGAVFIDGAMRYHGVVVGADFDFGLIDLDFNFIGYDHFHDDFFRLRDRPFRFDMPRDRIHAFFPHTVLHNDFHRDADGRFVNEGLGRDRVAALTHHPVEVVHADVRAPVGDRAKLADRPALRGAPDARGGAPDKRVFIPPARGGAARGADAKDKDKRDQ